MILEHDNYRTFLKTVLAGRVARNSSYSLRSFAKSLGVPHSTMSLILKGAMDLSIERTLEVSMKLGLGEKEQVHFLYLVQIGSIKNGPLMSPINLEMNNDL